MSKLIFSPAIDCHFEDVLMLQEDFVLRGNLELWEKDLSEK